MKGGGKSGGKKGGGKKGGGKKAGGKRKADGGQASSEQPTKCQKKMRAPRKPSAKKKPPTQSPESGGKKKRKETASPKKTIGAPKKKRCKQHNPSELRCPLGDTGGSIVGLEKPSRTKKTPKPRKRKTPACRHCREKKKKGCDMGPDGIESCQSCKGLDIACEPEHCLSTNGFCSRTRRLLPTPANLELFHRIARQFLSGPFRRVGDEIGPDGPMLISECPHKCPRCRQMNCTRSAAWRNEFGRNARAPTRRGQVLRYRYGNGEGGYTWGADHIVIRQMTPDMEALGSILLNMASATFTVNGEPDPDIVWEPFNHCMVLLYTPDLPSGRRRRRNQALPRPEEYEQISAHVDQTTKVDKNGNIVFSEKNSQRRNSLVAIVTWSAC
ncbi:hypothetical protein ACHAXT_003392 [Thalassiosira profunda]